jgi:hypothetical protein
MNSNILHGAALGSFAVTTRHGKSAYRQRHERMSYVSSARDWTGRVNRQKTILGKVKSKRKDLEVYISSNTEKFMILGHGKSYG